MVGLRPLNRSAKLGIGAKDVSSGKTTWVNLDNPRVARDLARHSTLGQTFQSGTFWQGDAGTVESGGIVTVTGNTASSTEVVIKRADTGANITGAADTEALTPAVVTNGRVNLLSVTLAAPQTLVETEGTAGLPATGANAVGLVGKPAVPASSVALAYVVWAPAISATVVAATNIWTQAAHGYTSGQKLVVAAVTTITAPIAGAEVYVKPIDANTFTLSATPGGADIDVTAADGSALLVPPAIVVDARP
jgi:hypothetical protein